MRFNAAYREDVVLDDGSSIELRLIRHDDKARLNQVLGGLSVRSRRFRFFVARGAYRDWELRYLSEVDGYDHLAIIAVRGDESLGVARFVRLQPGGVVAEPAFAIVDRYQGRGLGRILVGRLAAAAYERGISHFDVNVLADNHAMLRLLAGLGASIPPPAPTDDNLVFRLDLAASFRPWTIRMPRFA